MTKTINLHAILSHKKIFALDLLLPPYVESGLEAYG